MAGDPGRVVHLVVGSGCSHSDERSLVPWVVNLLFRVSGRSGVAGQMGGWTRDDLRVACVSLRELSDHTGSAGAGALPLVPLISSSPEWPAVGRGVTLDPGIGHFSIYRPRVVWCRGRWSSGVGVCHFVRLVDWSTQCVAAPVGSDIIPSVSVCVWGYVVGVSIVLLSIFPDAGGYADPSLTLKAYIAVFSFISF